MGDILRENGYGGCSHLYMSSDIRKCKWSRKIFEYIKAEYPDTEAGQILHIGDSPAADVDGASHAGINAELLPSGISRFYPEIFEKMYSLDGMLQDGALQFVSDMKKAADSFAGDVHWRKMDAAHPLEYYLHKSRPLDRAFFSSVKFEDDFGSNRSYDMASCWQRDIDERVGRTDVCDNAGDIEALRAALNDVSWRLSETHKSFSYRLGLALTALPRWVREMVMSSPRK